jgi:membrane associated rhomboid family serine protease
VIPLRDENPTTLTPFVTVTLIVLNCLVFMYEVFSPDGEQFVLSYAAVPAELFHLGAVIGDPSVPPWFTVISAMFLHGGLMHLAGNMLYLWIFGNNIEDVMGHGRFLAFFLLVGAVATLSHALMAPASTIPMVGASGAISGILGAYVLLFPYARIQVLVPIGIFPYILNVPAVVVLGLWIIMQIVNALFNWGGLEGGVAWSAHVGGFVAGLVLVSLFRRSGVERRGR